MQNKIFDIQRFADISNSTDNTIVTGTADADSIKNYGDNVTINALSGNDYIRSDNGEYLTINGGTGDDTIYNGDFSDRQYGPNVYQYSEGDGNDIIFGLTSEDTLMINGASTTVKNGDDTVIQVGNGSITIKESILANTQFDDTVLTGTADDKLIYNERKNVTINDVAYRINNDGDYVTINGGDTDNRIYNVGNNVVIYSGNGNDTIKNNADYTQYGNNITINAGEGDDYINNRNYGVGGNNITIYGGNGNDTIRNNGSNVLIYGGAGDDSLDCTYEDNSVYVYESGNDTISSGNHLRWATSYTGWTTDGNDLVINAAEGSVRITDSKDNWILLDDANGNLLASIYLSNSTVSGTSIDGWERGGYEVIVGANNTDNSIFAGAYGSSLYGGTGGNDVLYGNIGSDEFVYRFGDGQDSIFNAGIEDAVNLNGVSLEQITSAEIDDNGVNLKFTDGGSLDITGQVGTFIVSGQRYGADYKNKTWYSK